MRGMAIGMVIFFCSIAQATFIESEESTQAAKLWVYNALWFEILLLFLGLNLIANIFRYKMWLREKMSVFAFHISFIVIIIGAALTRFVGFEGQMHIREGESSSQIITAEPYVYINVNDGKMQLRDSAMKYMAESYPNSVDFSVKFPSHKNEVTIEYVDFKSHYIDSLVFGEKEHYDVLDIVVDGKSTFLLPGEDMDLGGAVLAYSTQKVEGVNIYKKGDSLVIKAAMPMQFIPMSLLQVSQRSGAPIPDSVYKSLLPGQEVTCSPKTLFMFAGRQFAFKQVIPGATKKLMPTGRKDRGSDYLTLKITDGNKSKLVTLEGGIDQLGRPKFFEFNGLNYSMEYGRRLRNIPFSVKCIDFQMERYPGSSMASAYASDIEINDPKNNVQKNKHLFMNHVVDYGGLRFFQSSYDEDEKGTVLSVNSDWWGTNVTYLGYLIMVIGMILSLFKKNLRFRILLDKLSKQAKVATVALLVCSTTAFGQDTAEHNHEHDHDHNHEHNEAPAVKEKPLVRFITEEHSDELASLLVQDYNGRIVPFHTVADQLLRKLYRSNKFEGKNAVQTILAMHMYPEYWIDQKIIQVPPAVRERLSLDKYVSFKTLSTPQGEFKWAKEYNDAIRTPEAKQNEFQKKLIKLGEKNQVFLEVISWHYFRILPLAGEANNSWYSPISGEIQAVDTVAVRLAFNYLSSLDKSAQFPSNYSKSSGYLMDLKAIQRQKAKASTLPSETHVSVEISYNRMGIFDNAKMLYFLFGTLLLILFLVKELSIRDQDRKWYKVTRVIFVSALFITFLYHIYGLCVRAYISGHAPWSDGYEALVFIAAVTMLAGFLFIKKNAAILAGAALLAGSMLMVSGLELLDPQVTPLQPVLKSYWLKIHVAVITGSYAFLGLAFILGFINLILFIVRGSKDDKYLTRNINELTYASEIVMMIGTFMLTIGTFLGGIWANESWGRYWGWDPKETWALVSVLVYAIVLHMRFIPGLSGKFVFNMLSFWAYSAILFTFFGVNFILVGLHSYAQGDGSVSLPNYVWYMVGIFAALTIWAGLANKNFQKKQKASL